MYGASVVNKQHGGTGPGPPVFPLTPPLPPSLTLEMSFFGKKKIGVGDYAKGVQRNYGKHPIPLVPHIEKRLNSMRSESNVKRGLQKATKRLMGIRQGTVYNEGIGGQYSMFTGPKGESYLPKHVEDALPPQVLQGNNSTQLLSGIGKQATIVALNLLTPTPALTFTGDKITSVIYEKATGDVTLNNIFLSNCYLIIYDIMCRKDVSNSTIGDPGSAWSQGATDTTGSSNSPTYLGSTPWQVEVFNQYYKVCQVTNVVLAAGGTHVHKVRLNPKKIISSAYAQYTQYGFKDVSYYCMIEIHGSPANDVTTQTQVSIGKAGLNIIQDKEETLKQLQNAKPTITTSNNLITSFTVGEQVVNIGGSTIVPQAEG